MTTAEIVTLVTAFLCVSTNIALYVHLSSTMNTRFNSVERRLELIQGTVHDIDICLTRMVAR